MKIGTTGTSFITENLIKAFINTDNEVIAIMSRSMDRAKELANKYQVDKVYTDYDLMLEDKNIDMIYIAVPNSLHFEYAKKALLANKNVILEKPFTTNFKEAKELYDLAINNKLYLFEAILTIHSPLIKQLKNDLNKLGKIHLVNINFSKYSRKYDELLSGGKPNNFIKEMAGGALYDLNIYNIHLMNYLFGNQYLKCHYYHNTFNDNDTSGIAIFKYQDYIISLSAAKDSHAKSNSQIMGELAYIEFSKANSIVSSYEIHYRDGNKETINIDNYHPYDNEIKHIKDIIDNNKYSIHQSLLEESLKVMTIVDELKNNT